MQKTAVGMLLMGFFILSACGSENANACLQASNLHACNAACTDGNAAACAQQAKLATEQCMNNGDLKVCGNMCLFAKTGKELYCKKQKELCSLAANKDSEACALYKSE